MPSQILAIQNVVVATGVAYDAEIAAANQLLFPAAIDDQDRTRPMLSTYGGGPPGGVDKYGVPHRVLQNPIDGDPLTIKQFNTRFGVVYILANAWGDIIPGPDPGVSAPDPRYYYPQVAQKDPAGIGDAAALPGGQTAATAGKVMYIPFIRISPDGRIIGGPASVANNNVVNANTRAYQTPAGVVDPRISTNGSYLPKDGLLSFKPLEGAALAAKQDELSRMQSVVQTLSRLLQAIQEQDSSFRNILK